MTEEQQQRVKAQLIELGFWGAGESGDPTRNNHDAGALNDRMQAKLAKGTYMVTEKTSDDSWPRQVLIYHTHQTYTLVSAADYIEAICMGALALPEFLRQHPECAAAETNEFPRELDAR